MPSSLSRSTQRPVVAWDQSQSLHAPVGRNSKARWRYVDSGRPRAIVVAVGPATVGHLRVWHIAFPLRILLTDR